MKTWLFRRQKQDINKAMAVLHLEVNKSFENRSDSFGVKRAAILIQRTVRNWLKKFEEEEEYDEQTPCIQVCDL